MLRRMMCRCAAMEGESSQGELFAKLQASSPSQSSRAARCQLSQRESPLHGGKDSGKRSKFAVTFAATPPPVKMQCRTARRLPGIALIKIILPLDMARAKRKPFKIVRPALPQQRHIICAQRKPHVRQHTSLRQHIIAAGTAAHRASRFWLYSSMET